jgi:hypothetical protein
MGYNTNPPVMMDAVPPVLELFAPLCAYMNVLGPVVVTT